jgi:hypothetical protein
MEKCKLSVLGGVISKLLLHLDFASFNGLVICHNEILWNHSYGMIITNSRGTAQRFAGTFHKPTDFRQLPAEVLFPWGETAMDLSRHPQGDERMAPR